MKSVNVPSTLLCAVQLGLFLALGACDNKDNPGNPSVQQVTGDASTSVSQPLPVMETGTFPTPQLHRFVVHGEYDDDGDGDGINETHVRRYIDREGDTAFSMTTNGRLWAWSLDTRGDESEIGKNYVIRDSNCDGVFDERYSLDAEFHVPRCLTEPGAADKAEAGQTESAR